MKYESRPLDVSSKGKTSHIVFTDKNNNKIKDTEPLVKIQGNHSEQEIIPASRVSVDLLKIKGIWPFDLYPDELIIQEKRIIVKQNYFPFYSIINSLPVIRIMVFEITHALFFSSVLIKGVYKDDLNATISWLKHSEAQKAKDLIDGLRLRDSESIEIMEREKKRVGEAIRLIGHT